jgi:hypothetical protein
MKPAYQRQDVKRQSKKAEVMQHYLSRNIGNTRLENAEKLKTKNTTNTTIMWC